MFVSILRSRIRGCWVEKGMKGGREGARNKRKEGQ